MSAPIWTWSGPLGELRAASSAGGGTALTTAASFIELPDGTAHLQITPTGLSTAKVVKLAINPFLIVLFTQDDLATVTEGSQSVQDAKTTTFALPSWDTAANKDHLYIGSRLPFRGVCVLVGTPNAVAATLTAEYWNGAWTGFSGTSDGTASAGATFAQNGNVTWTVPTDWKRDQLINTTSPAPADVLKSGSQLYWSRLSVSAQLTAGLTVQSILAMARSTAYAEYLSGQTLELAASKNERGYGNIEALTDGGTANLIVNVASRYDDGGFL